MLVKLLKYDLKYMLKNMSVFYILSIVFAILTRIFFSLNESTIVNIISQISVGCMFAMLVNILINTLMRSWVRFRDSIYKDEAYLTHTLPVTKNQIYNSKFIQTLIFFIISIMVIIISLFIAYYTKDRWIVVTKLIGNLTKSMDFNTTRFIISIVIVFFLEIFNALQCGYLGLLLGYRKDNNKIGFSVLFGFITYIISQIIVLLSIFVIGLFNSSVMDLFKSNIQINPSSFKLLFTLSIILYILIVGLMNIVGKKIFNKGVNIE